MHEIKERIKAYILNENKPVPQSLHSDGIIDDWYIRKVGKSAWHLIRRNNFLSKSVSHAYQDFMRRKFDIRVEIDEIYHIMHSMD